MNQESRDTKPYIVTTKSHLSNRELLLYIDNKTDATPDEKLLAARLRAVCQG